MSWPKRIVVVRHGESEGNVRSLEDICLENKANHSFALTVRGQDQARRTGEYLRTTYGHFDHYFCSTFRRTRETLALMYPEAEPIIDSRLNEWWRGIWYTLPESQRQELYPEEKIIRAREGEFHYTPPGGQSCPDVELMIHSLLQTLRFDCANESVLLVTHGNWMLLFWRLLLKRSPRDFELRHQSDKYPNCAVVVYEGDARGLKLLSDNLAP